MHISDESGKWRLLLCFLNLFAHHGLRDYFPTAISSISTAVSTSPTTVAAVDSTISKSIDHKLFPGDGTTSPPAIILLNEENHWTPVTLGLALAIIHWTWAIALVAAVRILNPKTKKIVWVVCLFVSGTLALLIDVSSSGSGGPYVLIGMRALQGLAQAPWLGSALGLFIGGATENSFVSSYIFGSLCVVLAVFCLFLPLSGHELKYNPKNIWKELLHSFPLWSCVFVQLATVFALHSFIVGIILTLTFNQDADNLIWAVSVIVLVSGIATRIMALGAKALMRTAILSALNRRRLIITLGCFISIVTLTVDGTAALDSPTILLVSSFLGIFSGISLSLVGTRLNLHDLGPSHPMPSLNYASVVAAIGAGLAYFSFPITAGVGISNVTNDWPYRWAWMLPVILLLVASLLYLFTLSVNPLPFQTILPGGNGFLPNQNGDVAMVNSDYQSDVDVKSFKSLKSGASFKTAISRSRTRTSSFKTVDEDFAEVDLRSIPESAFDEDAQTDLKSIKSVTSFRSIADKLDIVSPVIIDVTKINQTNDWLRTTRQTGKDDAKQIAMQKTMVERNVMMTSQW